MAIRTATQGGEMLGLIELLFVFLIALGWAVFELWGLRKKRGEAPRDPPADPQS